MDKWTWGYIRLGLSYEKDFVKWILGTNGKNGSIFMGLFPLIKRTQHHSIFKTK